jgi:hypothetical protein
VVAHRLQLCFGTDSGKVCNLWFECADRVGCGINDVDAKLLYAKWIRLQMYWKFADVGVEAHA